MTRPTHDVSVVLGTRPELIKLAPVIRSLRAIGLHARVVATGQHSDLVRRMADPLDVALDRDLDVMTHGQTLNTLTAAVVAGLADEIRDNRPRVLVVQGDTTTAVCAALAAFHEGIPVAHVEAGLRTASRVDPFPEEMNRRLIGRLATWHFSPTTGSSENLLAEGVSPDLVEVTGNTGIDNLLWVIDRGLGTSQFRSGSGTAWKVLVTLHRRESHGFVMAGLAESIRRLASRHSLQVVLPLHPNPAVSAVVAEVLAGEPNILLLPPLGYLDFIATLADCDFVLTDSGGVQEEAPALGKPVLILRNTTERPEAVQLGASRLVGVDPATLEQHVDELCGSPSVFARMAVPVFPYGDGRASERIAQRMLSAVGLEAELEPDQGNAVHRIVDVTETRIRAAGS